MLVVGCNAGLVASRTWQMFRLLGIADGGGLHVLTANGM